MHKSVFYSILTFLLLLAGCSERPERQIVDENSTRNKIDHLYAEIEQSIFNCRLTNGAWSFKTAFTMIGNKRPDLLHLDSTPDFLFCVNSNEGLWLAQARQSGAVAIYSPQPFSWKGKNELLRY
jgi:hypothetical protein